jgi:histidinol dehydrogenase
MLEYVPGIAALLERIKERSSLDNPEVFSTVMQIMGDIRSAGDSSLRKYTREFDGCMIDDFLVSEEEISAAYYEIDPKLLDIIKNSRDNIASYHEKQIQEGWMWDKSPGIRLGQKISAVERAGVYVPGGTAPLISSVLMNVVPAVVAGVKEIIMCTPPDKDGNIDCGRIVAAAEAGVAKIFKAGGAQAVFAMAFGTESIPKVDKITGPGNIYVANAKKLAYGYCGIDMIAGPSEILIIADDDANPAYAAADLLSQAEHDALAAAVLVVFNKDFAEKVKDEVQKQLDKLPRRKIAQMSLESLGTIYVANDTADAIAAANEMAPEHCELLVADPSEYIDKINNAGAIFVGEYSPEPLGDYWAGPNHTLPTGGTARFYSPLGVYDFYKRTSIIEYSRDALNKEYKNIKEFAKAEELDAHANSIVIRFPEDEDE